MNTTSLIATAFLESREAVNQMVIATLATMIAGAFFFFLGALFGWFIWRHAKAQTEHYTSENKRLIKEYKEKNRFFGKLKERLNEVFSKEEEPLS